MSATGETTAKLTALCRDAAREPAPPAFAALRAKSFDAFLASGLPDTRREAWRYTSLAPLAKLALQRPAAEHEPLLSRAHIEAIAPPVFACGLAVFANGRRCPERSGLPTDDAKLLPLESVGSPVLGALVDPKLHPFAALNGALAEQGVLLRIPEGVVLDHPLHLLFVSAASGAASVSSPRVVIEAGAGSRAVVIQDHVSASSGTPQFCNAVTEVQVEANASLDLVVLQREGPEDLHIANLAVRQEQGARFASKVLSLGGRLVRNDLGVTLSGVGAECELDGLFLGAGERLIDNHTMVDHAVPNGRSRQLYKGVLRDRARGVFRGRVRVRPDAQHSDAAQSNPNLLLSDGAEVDTRPQLEIHADDVKCRHGSATGRMDENALFYLRSRGIGAQAARMLLIEGFAAEVLQKVPGAALAESLRDEFRTRLQPASTP